MSCIPSNWMDSSKRRGTEAPGAKVKRSKTSFDENDSTHRDLVSSLLRSMRSQSQAGNADEDEAETEIVIEACAMLSAVPFSKMLQTISSTDATFEIPVVTRSYEEQYMRGPLHKHEPLCAMGSECECMMLSPKNKFVGIQFEIPYTVSTLENNLCIFCLRKITQLLYYETVERGVPIKHIIQKHGNICGEQREYHPSAMLVSHGAGPVQCLPMPIVAHQRNKLIVETVGGVPYVRQRNVYMEDF